MRQAFVALIGTAAVFAGCSGGGTSGVASPANASPRPSASPSASVSSGYGFAVTGSTVRGFGTVPKGASVAFVGAANTTYDVSIDAGATLVSTCDNAVTTGSNACGQDAHALVAMGGGTFVNRGSLQVYPSEATPGVAYHQVDDVITLNIPTGTSMRFDNFGTIGDERGKPAFYGPVGYYGQGPAAALLIAGDATVINEAGGLLAGNNAFFTKSGSGTLDNFGTIFGVNDGVLSGYVVGNHQNAGIVTGIMGYAAIHEYGPVRNDGYILGSDYGVLLASGDLTDEGGPAVAGVTDVGGHPVYGGEINAIPRGATTPDPLTAPVGTAVTSRAAIEFEGDGRTVTLRETTDGTHIYLPDIGGTIEGGYNGNDTGSTHRTNNTVAFDFPDVPATTLATFRTALAAARHTTSAGSFITGTISITVPGTTSTYALANVAHVSVNGITL